MASLSTVHLSPDDTFDLREDKHCRRWNFLKASNRAEARRIIAEAKPFNVIRNTPCTAYCAPNERRNYRRMDPAVMARCRAEADTLFLFELEIYELQRACAPFPP